MERKKTARIYVCHTFYHVYVACLKELNLPRAKGDCAGGKPHTGRDGTERPPAADGGAALVLSRMSNDFGDLDVRARESGLFDEVVWFDEKPYTFFEELAPLKEDTGSLPGNMRNRIRFCRRLAQLEEPYVPVDFTQYEDIYVFCDSDPIGYYLNYKKIRYHAVEDGLNCIRYLDTARVDNRGHFGLKTKLAAMGLIFIQNGYSRYCIDMEVNDLSAIDRPMSKMREVSREKLVQGLTAEGRERLVRLFIANREELMQALIAAGNQGRPAVLILTEPLCTDLSVRKRLIEDMIHEYGTFEFPACDGSAGRETGQGVIVIKPHPRDLLDYREAFPEHIVLDAKFPMEILNFLELPTAPGGESGGAQDGAPGNESVMEESVEESGGKPGKPDMKPDGKSGGARDRKEGGADAAPCLFERVVTVYTVPGSIHCAKEKIYLGNAFMDRYEDAQAHANVTDHGESVLGQAAPKGTDLC